MGVTLPEMMMLQAAHTVYDPADSTTYYFGQLGGSAPSTGNIYQFSVPTKCYIKAVTILANVGTPGTNESSTLYVRVNNSTDYTVTAALNYDAALEQMTINGLNIPLAQGDYFSIKLVTPAWATNPLQIREVVGILLTN